MDYGRFLQNLKFTFDMMAKRYENVMNCLNFSTFVNSQ